MRFNINYEQSKSRKVATVPLDATTLFQGCILGADTHADTSCVGRHAYIIAQVMGRSVKAVPFSPSLGSVQNLSIVHAAYAYDDQETGLTTILIIHNAIFVPDMDNVLLYPDQARENNVKIDLSPTHYDEDSPYAITWPDGFSIPFFSRGPVPSIQVRRPTEAEMNDTSIQHRVLTGPHEWDPYKSDPSQIATMSSRIMYICIYNGSISEELVHRATYNHPSFHEDSKKII